MSDLKKLSGAELKQEVTRLSQELDVGKPIIDEHPGHEVPTVPEGTSMTEQFKSWQSRCRNELNQA